MLASIYHLRFRAKPGPEVSSTGTSRPTAPGLHSARSVLTTPSRRNTPLHNLAKILAYPPHLRTHGADLCDEDHHRAISGGDRRGEPPEAAYGAQFIGQHRPASSETPPNGQPLPTCDRSGRRLLFGLCFIASSLWPGQDQN